MAGGTGGAVWALVPPSFPADSAGQPAVVQSAVQTWGPTTVIVLLAAVSLAALWRTGVIKPRSFTGRARDLSALPWWGWIAAAMAMHMAQYIGASLGLGVATAARLTGGDPGDRTLAEQALIGTGAYLVSIAAGAMLILVLVRDRDDRGGAAAGLRVRAADPFAGLAWFLLTIPIVFAAMNGSAALLEWLSGEPGVPIAHDVLRTIIDRRTDPWTWLLTAGAVVGAPVAEELTYRVFLQSGILALFRRTWPAVLTTSVLFTAAHIGVVDWPALPGLFVFGVALGVAYERSRSPLVPMTMHALFNGANVVLAVLAAG